MVWGIAQIMVNTLFESHDTVVLDATNLTRKRRDEWCNPKWVREYRVVPATVETCIQRAHVTNQEYLVPVIQRMAATWEQITDDEIDVMVNTTQEERRENTVLMYQGELKDG